MSLASYLGLPHTESCLPRSRVLVTNLGERFAVECSLRLTQTMDWQRGAFLSPSLFHGGVS